jgi:hypothetical protein
MRWLIDQLHVAQLCGGYHRHGDRESLMNTCVAKIQDGAAEGNALLDVLPSQASFCPAGWVRREYALVESLAAALNETAQRHAVSGAAILCAALALVESRFTGAQTILASCVDANGSRQFPTEVPRAGARNAWLQAFSSSLDTASPINGSTGWMVSEYLYSVDAEPSCDDVVGTINSRWNVDASATKLEVVFRAPLNANAIDMLYAAVVRALTGLCASASMVICRWSMSSTPTNVTARCSNGMPQLYRAALPTPSTICSQSKPVSMPTCPQSSRFISHFRMPNSMPTPIASRQA